MRRFAALLVTVIAPLVAPLATPLTAQAAHPDFSGKWTIDASQGGPGMEGVSGTVTITQNEKTMKAEQNITSPMGAQSAVLTFNLDGSPAKNSVNAGGMALELNSKAAWEGNTLVVTSTTEVQGNAVTTVERWSLDSGGQVLTLDSNISFGGQSMSRKQTFKKS